jgi:hypothetical protein
VVSIASVPPIPLPGKEHRACQVAAPGRHRRWQRSERAGSRRVGTLALGPLAAVEALAERARGDDGDREALVANALRRLMSGELDSVESLEGAARRLRDSRFNSI